MSESQSTFNALPQSDNADDSGVFKDNSCVFNQFIKSEWEEYDSQRSPFLEPTDDKLMEEDDHIRLQGNYVYNMLMKSAEGRLYYKLYQIESKESKSMNCNKKTFFSIHKVAKMIIFHEIDCTGNYNISKGRLFELAGNAAEVFPTYRKSCFYILPTSTSNPRGALQSSYENVREKALRCDLLKSTSYKRKRDNSQVIEFSEELNSLKTEVNYIDSNYIKKWAESAVQQKIEFFKTNDLKTIFETFPNLKKAAGYLLVQADFLSFYRKPTNLFQTKWPMIADKIMILARRRRKKDPLINDILQADDGTLEQEHLHFLALMVLPFLFKKIAKGTAKSKAGKNWFPEKQTVLNTFILYIKETENFTEALEKAQISLKQIHTDHQLWIHPHVIVNGDSVKNIRSSYVSVADHIYEMNSPTCAVDLCFKLYKVFYKKYPLIANHIWQFLEESVYGFTVKDIYKGVSDVIVSLEQI